GAAEAGSFTSSKALWCVLSAAACAIAYLGFREAFCRRVSLIAAVACAFSFGLHVTATSLNNEPPYMPVVFPIGLLTLSPARTPSLRLTLVIAALHGLALLLRAEHALALLLMTAYAMWMMPAAVRPPRRLAIGAVMSLGAILMCAPWSVHGWIAIDRFNTA